MTMETGKFLFSMLCLAAAALAVAAFLDILLKGSGFGCIVREKNK